MLKNYYLNILKYILALMFVRNIFPQNLWIRGNFKKGKVEENDLTKEKVERNAI